MLTTPLKASYINEIIKEAGSRLISVSFTKADGTERQLTFNPRDFNDIKGTGTECSDPNVFRVREVTKNQWRSFRAERVISIKANGNIHSFAN